MNTRDFVPRTLWTAAIASALLLGGCNGKNPEVVPSDGGTAEKFADYERRLHAIETERDSAVRSATAAGLEAQSLTQILADIRARLAAVEHGAPPAAAASDTASGSTSVVPSAGPTVTASVLAPAGSDGVYSDDQIAAFRKIWEETQKRKDAEVQAERVKKQLEGAGVTLTAQQEAAVIKLQAQYRDKISAIWQSGFNRRDDAARAEAGEKVKVLRDEFETDLRAAVPSGDADKIVAALAQNFPGFYRAPGSRGSGMNPAMSGN